MSEGRSTRENVQIMQRVLQDHLKYDLEEEDRRALRKAGNRFAQSALLGSMLGALGGLSLAFRGRFALKNMRNLPALFNQGGKPNMEALRERMVFGIRASLYFSLGMLCGVQVGGVSGWYLAQNVLAHEGNRERIANAMQATQRELNSTMRTRGGALQGLSKPDQYTDGENTSLATSWEREQPQALDENRFRADSDAEEKEASIREDGKRSRWDELRNNSANPSRWAAIRQDKARTDSNSIPDARQDIGTSGPDLGAARSKSLEERQREFDALMEKERKASNDGFLNETSNSNWK